MKAAKAVGLVLCCFLACWFPLLAVWPLRLFWPHAVSDRTFRLCLWLNYACSTCNPLLYALANPRVRACARRCALACKLLGGASERKHSETRWLGGNNVLLRKRTKLTQQNSVAPVIAV